MSERRDNVQPSTTTPNRQQRYENRLLEDSIRTHKRASVAEDLATANRYAVDNRLSLASLSSINFEDIMNGRDQDQSTPLGAGESCTLLLKQISTQKTC